MKVLILENTAGVFSPIVKWLNEHDHEVKICTRYEQDKLYQVCKLKGAVIVDTPSDYFKMAFKLIRSFKPDIIHVNSSVKLLIFVRLLTMRTPILFVHHGVATYNFIAGYDIATKLADFVQKTTPDIRAEGTWVDRLVDDKFYYRGGREENTALLMYRNSFYVDYREQAKEWAKTHGIKLTIFNQSEGDFILHDNMPEFLSKFEYFLDWKGHEILSDGLLTFSVTAMEAFLCGCKVIHDSNMDLIIEDMKIIQPEDYYNLYKSLGKPTKRKMLYHLFYTFKGICLWGKQSLFEKMKGS